MVFFIFLTLCTGRKEGANNQLLFADSVKNLPKIIDKSMKNAILERLGAVLGASWSCLGRPGAVLGRLGAILGRFGAVLEPS